MSVVSEVYDIFFLIFTHMYSIDLLIDKQELIINKVLEVNGSCCSETMDVCVSRQFEGKFIGLHINSETFVLIYHSLHRAKRQP